MGLIAEDCPRCKRVTRCLVVECQGFFGGLLLGIPFVLPLSSARCMCGECGHEFRSRLGAEDRAVPPELATGLDTDALLGLTNPDLREARILSDLRTAPQLRGAFHLLDRLPPGSLHSDLRATAARWPSLGEPARADLLARVEACDRAEGFARAMRVEPDLGGFRDHEVAAELKHREAPGAERGREKGEVDERPPPRLHRSGARVRT